MVALNEQQKAIVDFVLNETASLNVIARAGTGKTYTLVNGICLAIAEGTKKSVALTAFNKSAATEFEQRLSKLANETKVSRLHEVETGTMHSFGFRFWRQYVARKVTVENYKVFNILRDQNGDNFEFLHQTAKLVSLAKQSAFIDAPKVEWNRLIEHHDIDANGNAEKIIDAAIAALKASNAQKQTIDFDDMIYLPIVYDIKVDQYDFVLIDEAQDTNAARRLLAFKMLKPVGGRLIAVGDDKQAIYGFTGADADSLALIQEHLNSVTLPLTVTYRCPKAVVAEANELVPDLQAHESAPEGKVRSIASYTERKAN